jgi:hypothetical protein
VDSKMASKAQPWYSRREVVGAAAKRAAASMASDAVTLASRVASLT